MVADQVSLISLKHSRFQSNIQVIPGLRWTRSLREATADEGCRDYTRRAFSHRLRRPRDAVACKILFTQSALLAPGQVKECRKTVNFTALKWFGMIVGTLKQSTWSLKPKRLQQ